MINTARAPFRGVIHLRDIRLYSCGQIAGDGIPRGLVNRPGRSVVAASATVFVWNLCHVPKLNPHHGLVEGLFLRRQNGRGGAELLALQQFLQVPQHHFP